MNQITQPPSVCPKCGMNLRLNVGDFGKFFGCSGYPQCDYTLSTQNFA